MAEKYVRLVALVDDLARQSGEPPARILDILASYDRAGLLPTEMLMSASAGRFGGRGALADLVASLRSGYRIVAQDSAAQMGDVLVATEVILQLCDRYDVRPPTSVASWLRRRHGRHLTFPALPTPPRPAPTDSPADVEEVEVYLSWMERVTSECSSDTADPDQTPDQRDKRFRRCCEAAERSLSVLLDGPTRQGLAARKEQLAGAYDQARLAADPRREAGPRADADAVPGWVEPDALNAGTTAEPRTTDREPSADGPDVDSDRTPTKQDAEGSHDETCEEPVIRLDRAGREMHVADRIVSLGPPQFLVMLELCKHPNEWRTRHALAQRAEGRNDPADPQFITRHISDVRVALRKALQGNPDATRRVAEAIERARIETGRNTSSGPSAGGVADPTKALIACRSAKRERGVNEGPEHKGSYRLALCPSDVAVE